MLTDRCPVKSVFLVCCAVGEPNQDAAVALLCLHHLFHGFKHILIEEGALDVSHPGGSPDRVGCQLTIGSKALHQVGARRKGHHGHFVFALQVAEDLQRRLRQGGERGMHRLGHVEEKYHGERQLIVTEIADGLRHAIFVELKIFSRQRIQGSSGLFVFHQGVEENKLRIDMDDWGLGLRGRSRSLRRTNLREQKGSEERCCPHEK